MFPTTITIHNISDLQKVMSVLFPATGVVEIVDKSRGIELKGSNDKADLARQLTTEQALVNQAEAKVAAKKSSTPAATPTSPAHTPPTAEVVAADAPAKTADASVPDAASAETAQPASTAATDAPAPTYKEAAEAVTALSRKKGRDAAIAVLKTFGADKLPDVKPEQFADVIAACQAALEG